MEKKPSFKMKKGVKMCEDILKITCNDKSFDGMKKFLDENMPKLKEIDIREHKEPSEKQEYAIDFIENNLDDVEFKGKTMKDASEFISQYYEKAREVADARRK